MPSEFATPENSAAPCTGLIVRPTPLPATVEESAPTHSPQEISLARQKTQFVEMVWELARTQKISLQKACTLAATHAHEDFPALASIGHGKKSALAEGRAWFNYRAWARALGREAAALKPNAANWSALLPAYRGARKYERPGPAEFWIVLARLYENERRLSLRAAYDYALYAAKQSNLPVAVLPTLAQVNHYYAHHADRKAVALARQGEEWFKNNMVAYIMRTAPRVDDCWISDHHIFDAPCKIFDHATGRWQACRPWLTSWLDWGSLFFMGFQVRALSPNRDTIERALKQALLKNNCVPPLHLYTDNGKDYQAIFKADDRQCIGNMAALLGCRIHFAIPYNARAKVIERIHQAVCEFSKLMPGYRGNCPANRPEDALEHYKHPESLPTIAEFSARFEYWISTFYNGEPSNGEILNGKSPAQARANHAPLRAALDAQTIYKAFLRELPGVRKIGRGGMVRALNRWYRGDCLWLAKCKLDEVRVKVDPDDIATAWIFTADGRELGCVHEIERLPALIAGTENDTPETVEKLREAMKLQRRQLNEAKAASAAQRGFGRFLRQQLGSGAEQVFQLPPAAVGPAASLRAPREVTRPTTDPILAAELDAALRAETSDRLAEFQREDTGDAALLAEIEAELATH